MSNSNLARARVARVSKKLAKDRLVELRRTDPEAKLATALFSVARDHGFPSWRALKAEIERRQQGTATRFFAACAQGDVAELRDLLAKDPGLVHARHADAPLPDATGLHAAAGRVTWCDCSSIAAPIPTPVRPATTFRPCT